MKRDNVVKRQGPMYVIGTDEAGYGPNLGPLLATATLWRVECGPGGECAGPGADFAWLYDRLAPVIGQSPRTGEIWVADSKKLHRKDTLLPLERALFPALYALGMWTPGEAGVAGEWDSDALFDLICGSDHAEERRAVCWNTPETRTFVPRCLDADTVAALGGKLRERMSAGGVELRGVRSDAVFPERFNSETRRVGSKGAFLSDTTLALAARFWRQVERENRDVTILCDKHGGRNFYIPVLWDHFPGLDFGVVTEGTLRSEYYHRTDAGAYLRVCFSAKGEAALPVALASVVCKYLRELEMGRFNAFWSHVVPGIAPTAGYPLDAKRFRAEIAPHVAARGLDWNTLWRER